MPLLRAFKIGRRAATAIASLVFASSVWAIPEAQFQPAFELFMQASKGDDGSIVRSAEAFTALLKAEPGNPVLMAYAGAATSMKANTTLLPWKKMGYAEDGMALLDKALALLTPAHDAPLQRGVPAALEVRFVAASTSLGVPGFMNRGTRGTRLLNEVLSSPLLVSAPLGFRGNVWMKAATVATNDKHIDEARKYLTLVIQANAPQADAARAQLAKLPS